MRSMRRFECALLFSCALHAQQVAPATSSQLTIHLEQLRHEHVIPVRPEHVFDQGDVVRFRVNSSFDGYLYVINQGTSGQYTVLFPASSGTGSYAVAHGSDVLVPAAEDGWFQIEGLPGFETVYFLISPTQLNVSTGGKEAAPKPSMAAKSSLLPRCNDAIFQARGECVDDSAGAAVLPRDVPLPPRITVAAPNASRDLVLTQDADGTVNVKRTGAGPAVYLFRLAHK